MEDIAQTYNDVIDAASAALITRVRCPGIDAPATGYLIFDHWGTALLRRCGLATVNERSLLIPTLVSAGPDSTPFIGWCCLNDEEPHWLCLQHFLAQQSSSLSLRLFTTPDKDVFLVSFMYNSLPVALVFERQTLFIID